MVNKLKELRNSGSEEGFTLIELMIVVVIIGILAAIAIPIFMNQQKGAIVAGVKSDVKNTNTNVVTFLVKKPTATAPELAATQTGKAAATGTGAANYKIVVTDDATTVAVGGGKWDAYTVTGTNTAAGDDAGKGARVTFSATTGKIVTDTNYTIPTPPVTP